MNELNNLIQRVAEKSKSLKSEVAERAIQIETLQTKVNLLLSEKAELEEQVNDLKQQLTQLSDNVISESTDTIFNNRIDELVREIDECIHHLKQ